jgi:hypothetical protein
MIKKIFSLAILPALLSFSAALLSLPKKKEIMLLFISMKHKTIWKLH